MRIYVSDTDYKKYDNLNKYYYKTINKQYFYTDEGIFTLYNHNITKQLPVDIEIEKFSFDNYNFIIDKSYLENVEQVFQLPYEHYIINVESKYYTLRKNANIKLVIEYVNKKYHDFYFETNEDIRDYMIKEDILTFLSMLN